jgi:hypothetical protein
MASVIVWMCPCGTHLKAVHSSPGNTVIRCANSECSSTHTIAGHVDSLFVEDENGHWQSVQQDCEFLGVDAFHREASIAPRIQTTG